MKKQFLNLGNALNKVEQKHINGGRGEVGFGEACKEDRNTPCDPLDPNSCMLSETCVPFAKGTDGLCKC